MGGLGGVLLLSMLGASISGVVVATIAKAILPGKQRVSGIELFVIGTSAAWLGGVIAGLFGWGDGRGIHWGVLAFQVAIAAIVIYFWTDFRNKQVKKAIVPGPAKGKDKDDKGGGMMTMGPGADDDKDDKDKKGGKGVPGVPGI